jgi:glycosyltransferase involved in cell wall biosynthesis
VCFRNVGQRKRRIFAMPPPLRIFYLTSYSPVEKSYGAQLRTCQVASALQTFGQVDCVVVNHEDSHLAGPRPRSPVAVQREIQLQPVPPRSLWERFRCGVDPRFVNFHGHAVPGPERSSVLSRLPDYDLVWLHHLHTANVFGQWSWPRSVLDLDDIPSSFLRTVRQNAPSLGKRIRAGLRMPVAQGRERLLGERFTVLSVCSEADRQCLPSPENVHVIPNGFERPSQDPVRNLAVPPRIGFIGRFDHLPNSDGIRWFIKECWPAVKRAAPECRLRLVGEGSHKVLDRPLPDVDQFGWLPDPTEEIASWSAMIVPLRLGAGTRIKIAEAFSRKCPVVSTPLGAYGYDLVHGQELLLAGSPDSFANACVSLIRDPAAGAALADRAWRRFLAEWTWERIVPRVLETAEDCLRRSKAESKPGPTAKAAGICEIR